jgi:alpha-1,3-glucosyltransferase
MFWAVFLAASCVKILLIPSYKSTDFEVHRNWLSITSSLPISQWYTDTCSEWTLDYPPFFAWFELALSKAAPFFDPEMLKVGNHSYSSPMTVIFQRLTVIFTDIVFALGAKAVADNLSSITSFRSQTGTITKNNILVILLLSNAGLFMVDHIHFQYNGFLFGVMLLSIAAIMEDKFIKASFWFSVLLNLKHIYVYIAPAYFVYLLRTYCFKQNKENKEKKSEVISPPKVSLFNFSLTRLISLGCVVISVFALSFGPFIYIGQLQQVVSRLFPFKRGLCHAYWAPNFWAIYNGLDKSLLIVGKKLGLLSSEVGMASMTGGLVQEFSHSVLPSVPPLATFVLTFVSMIPALAKLWLSPNSPVQFVRCVVLCAWSSFLFGWHVHEKAVLLIILPLAILSVVSRLEARYYLLISTIGHFSLFPLLFTPRETLTKVLLHLVHWALSSALLTQCHGGQRNKLLCWWEKSYLAGTALVFLYDILLHGALGLDKRLPFLPLLFYSLYCSIGIFIFYLRMYKNYLLSN